MALIKSEVVAREKRTYEQDSRPVELQVYEKVTLNYLMRREPAVQAWRETITKGNNFADCKQQFELVKWEQLQHLKERISAGKITVKRGEVAEQIDSIEQMTYLECFSYLIRPCKTYFVRWLNKSYASINNAVLMDIIAEDGEGAGANLMQVMECKASKHELEMVDFIENLTTVLTKTQFEHVKHFIDCGEWKNKNNTKVKRNIKKNLAKIYTDKQELSEKTADALYNLENSVKHEINNITVKISRQM